MYSLICVVIVCAGWLGLGYYIGRAKGYKAGHAESYKAGRDSQWCEIHFAKIEADKARRNKSGQFKRRA